MDPAQACRDLQVRFGVLIDTGRATEVPDLFVEDGRWQAGSAVIEGREALVTALAARAAKRDRVTVHLTANQLVEPVGDGRATGTCLLAVHVIHDADGATNTRLETMSWCEDEFVLDGDTWKFRSRTLTPAGGVS